MAAALIVSSACPHAMAGEAVLAICPAGRAIPAALSLPLDATATAPSTLIIAETGTALAPDCQALRLPFPPGAVRWLGVLPGNAAASDRLAITAREPSGEIVGIEVEKPSAPRPSRHLPSRRPGTDTALPKRPAAWAWNPRSWQDDADALIAAASRLRAGALYISVPSSHGAVSDADALAAFIQRSGEADIAVYAVEGDPAMVTDEGLALAAMRARALAAYRVTHASAPLAGVQYDIEPYLLASFSAAPEAAWMRWSAALHTLSDALGEPVDAVIPYWIDDSPGGEAALIAARPALRCITIMAYRTALDAILDAAAPALLFAEAHGLPATVGLEAGPIAKERRGIFRRAAGGTGELHLAALGGVTAALLLEAPQAESATSAYRKSHFVPSDPARVTFAGRTPHLFEVAGTLATALTAYPAAQRIAFHGLSDFESSKKPYLESFQNKPIPVYAEKMQQKQ